MVVNIEELLMRWIDTFDLSLKKYQTAEDLSGFSRLTVSQLLYIEAINVLGEPAITAIAEKMKVSKASATIGVNKLIQMGYATKTQSNVDKRVFHASLTETGNRLVLAKYEAMRDYAGKVRKALSEEELRQFEASLEKIIQSK